MDAVSETVIVNPEEVAVDISNVDEDHVETTEVNEANDAAEAIRSEMRERVNESRRGIFDITRGLTLFSNLCDLAAYKFDKTKVIESIEATYKFCNQAMKDEVGTVPMSRAGKEAELTSILMTKTVFWRRVHELMNTSSRGNPTKTLAVTIRSDDIETTKEVNGIPFRERESLIGYKRINTDGSVQYGMHPYLWKMILEHYRGNVKEGIVGINSNLELSYVTPTYAGSPWKLIIDFSKAIEHETAQRSVMYGPSDSSSRGSGRSRGRSRGSGYRGKGRGSSQE
jgi:hypothetical protein